MSEKEKGELLEQIKNLPESDKQFVLGYAAGITAKSNEQNDKEESKPKE